jgi:exo-beta-1,3-glucanase (GH17 family)
MLPHWNLMRIYSSSDFAGTLLSVIRENDMEMKVVLGVWIDPEEKRDSTGVVVESYPDARADNAREAEAAIRLAEAYPEIVTAICVGNETQIYWSAHRSPLDILVGYVRRVREGAVVPVTAADDFNYWNKPESRKLAAEIDFIMLHAHPMWNGIQLEDALGWLKEQLAAVQQMHPGRDVIIGETGWATSVGSEGEQSVLIKGKPGEAEQRRFYIDLRAWADSARQPVFYFEAFDENWKGGDDPEEVEKHWGLFRADRTPKAAMR